MVLLSPLRVTGLTTVPKVTLEFICSVGVGIIPINGVSRPLDAVLTPVLSMLDMLTVERMMRVHGIRIG